MDAQQKSSRPPQKSQWRANKLSQQNSPVERDRLCGLLCRLWMRRLPRFYEETSSCTGALHGEAPRCTLPLSRVIQGESLVSISPKAAEVAMPIARFMLALMIVSGTVFVALAVHARATTQAQTSALTGQVTSTEEGPMEGVLVTAK